MPVPCRWSTTLGNRYWRAQPHPDVIPLQGKPAPRRCRSKRVRDAPIAPRRRDRHRDATPEARATRRWKEYQAKGIDTPYEEVLADVKQRDYQDTHREAAPLKQAEDAVLLDTSELNFEQSFEAMKQIIAAKV